MRNGKQFPRVLLLLALAVAACTGPGSAASQGINEGNRARGFTLESLDGSKVSLSDYEGNVVLVNFWATWCAPCRAEIPDIEAAYQAHKDDGFVVLGISTDESRQVVEPFVAELDMTYPVLLDERGEVMNEYRVRGLPMSLLVDREGIIRARHLGFLTGSQLAKYLEDTLSGQ